MTEIKFDPIQIRFDGLDAENHKIDLAQFGKSALGISKIMATTAQFIVTGNYSQTQRRLDYKVLIGSAEDNCLTFEAVIQALNDIPVYKAIFIGVGIKVGGDFLTDCYRMVFKFLWHLFTSSENSEKTQQELEKKLSEAYDKETVSKLIDTRQFSYRLPVRYVV